MLSESSIQLMSSYCSRLYGSTSTAYASAIRVNFFAKVSLPFVLSGWSSRDHCRYFFLISAGVASSSTPRTS